MLSGHNWELHVGDVRETLRSMPAESVHCVVTSPPYWGLRAYGTDPQVWGGRDACEHSWGEEETVVMDGRTQPADFNARYSGRDVKHQEIPVTQSVRNFCRHCNAWRGELGLEPTPDLFVEHTVEVFREVRRVLRGDGIAWVNLGDSYSGSDGGAKPHTGGLSEGVNTDSTKGKYGKTLGRKSVPGLKPKDLCMIPARCAIALQADGWYLRSQMPWTKRSQMPGSERDRPSGGGSAVEYVYMLTKNPRYYFDMDAVRVASSGMTGGACFGKINRDGPGSREMKDGENEKIRTSTRAWRPSDLWFQSVDTPHGLCGIGEELVGLDVNPQPFSGSHFATFPERFVQPLILSATSEKGCCPECGKPWERVVERSGGTIGQGDWHGKARGEDFGGDTLVNDKIGGQAEWSSYKVTTLGWQPACDCKPDSVTGAYRIPQPCRVLDPFAGSCTTLRVARQLGRIGIGIELSEKYARDIGVPRITKQDSPVKQHKSADGQLSLL